MNLPKDPSGTSPLTHWLKSLKEFVRRRQILPGPGYRIKQTPNGIILEIIFPAGGNNTSGPSNPCPFG